MNPKKNILTIYAIEDKKVLQYLLLHLQQLEKEFDVCIWSDNPVYPEQQWKPLNKSRLDDADVFLLLLSNTLMYSEFVKQDEFKMVIDRYKEGRATVIPILLDECPWDVEFTSDDYNFNFKELQVFPKNEKPIGNWYATDETFKQLAHFITELFTTSIGNIDQKEPSKISEKKKLLDLKKEEQIAINFLEEEDVNTKAEKQRTPKIEVEAKKRIEEKNKLSEQAEAIEVIRKEKRQRQKAETQKRIEQEKRLKEKAKKDKKIEEGAAAKEIVKEEKRENEKPIAKTEVAEKHHDDIARSENEFGTEQALLEDISARRDVMKKNRLAAYNYQFKTANVAEAKDVAIEEKRENQKARILKKLMEEYPDKITEFISTFELKKRLGEVVSRLKTVKTKISSDFKNDYRFKIIIGANHGAKKEKSTNEKSRMRAGLLIAGLLVSGLLIYIFSGDPENLATELPESKAVEVGSESMTETTIAAGEQGESFSKLTVGDAYGEGIVFTIDQAGTTGKIAHLNDAGPMSWKQGMKIHEHLGEGWRLPTMEELQLMYQTIGQGANNSGRFSDEFYWSATPFDTYQARLVRFRDGNTSYHYNKEIEERQFLVRAVRDFSR